MADKISGPDEVGPDEADLEDGRTFQIKEYEKNGRSFCLGFEVTAYKRLLEDYILSIGSPTRTSPPSITLAVIPPWPRTAL